MSILPSPHELTTGEIIIRLLVAFLLCGIIGVERKHYHKPAGLRTNILVGVGAAGLMLISLQIYHDYNSGGAVDIGRVIGQVVTGIGFLGAGAIIQGRGSIHGLTTAASIWVVSAIGMAVGLGYYVIAVATTAFSIMVLDVVGRIEHNVMETKNDIPKDQPDLKQSPDFK